MTRADRILIAVLVACAVLSAPLVTWAMPRSESVTISGPAGVTRIDPSVDATYHVTGRIGPVTVVSQAGQVRVTDSTCPDGICVRSGALGPGRPLVCAPNGVVVSFGGQGGLDAVSR